MQLGVRNLKGRRLNGFHSWQNEAGARHARPGSTVPFELTLGLLGGFALLVAAFGGSSRADPIQIAFLRPLAALSLIPALYLMDAKAWRQVPSLMIILGAFGVWMGLQLVPLPPGIWQSLPDRDVIAELDRLVGLSEQWRPISLAPMRGMNALISLIVPASALLLALATRSHSRTLFQIILAVGIVNAAIGFVQVVTGPNSPYYLYQYVAPRSAAGLFANENHSTVFSALVLLIIARLSAEAYLSSQRQLSWTRIVYPTAFLFILLSILVTGSRAGLAALIVAIGASGWMAWQVARSRGGANGRPHSAPGSSPTTRALPIVFGMLAAALLGLFILQERTPALQDIFEKSAFEDLRWRILPIIEEMAGNHWLLGAGFGSFDILYQTYEPTNLVMVAYVNHAHNDWLQIVIEGGLPASVFLVALLVWVARSILQVARDQRRELALVKAAFWLASLLVIGAASVVDYPLRTPIYQAAWIWLLLCLALDSRQSSEADVSEL